MWGHFASVPGGPDEIAMLAGDSGHSAVDLAFRLTVLLHTKASLGDARAQSASGHSAVDLAFRLTVLLHPKASLGDARAQSASSAVCKLRLR